MTIQLFLTLVTILSAISGGFTEAMKRFLSGMGKEPSANLLALINAIVVGGCGMITYYILTGVTFSIVNVASFFIMIFIIWMVSMIGYDKVMQLIDQILKLYGDK